VREQLALLDKAVARTGYVVGGGLTLADIFVLPMLHYLKLLPESAQMLAPSTDLGRYLEAHAARPSYVRTIPPPGPPRRATR
jgi:glutathione S-transferase